MASLLAGLLPMGIDLIGKLFTGRGRKSMRGRRRRKRMSGRGFCYFLKKGSDFLIKTGAIIKAARMAGELGVPHMDKVLKVSSALGMGRRRRRRVYYR